jgi:phenylalanyl-tRNA synthetase beta chain
VGHIFFKDKEEIKEEKRIAIISSNDDFYEIKGKISLFFRKFLLKEVIFGENEENIFCEKNKSAKIIVDNEEVGYFGEISQKARKIIKVKHKAVIAEINFDKMVKLYGEVKLYDSISKFPESLRDIAIFIPEKTPYIEILKKIKSIGGKKLKEVVLFDVYSGKEVPVGAKSFAFRLSFQDKNKTLSSEEINTLYKKIIDALDAVPEWKVRK